MKSRPDPGGLEFACQEFFRPGILPARKFAGEEAAPPADLNTPTGPFPAPPLQATPGPTLRGDAPAKTTPPQKSPFAGHPSVLVAVHLRGNRPRVKGQPSAGSGSRTSSPDSRSKPVRPPTTRPGSRMTLPPRDGHPDRVPSSRVPLVAPAWNHRQVFWCSRSAWLSD